MKKITSLLLVFAMVLAMAPSVFATVEKPASMAIVGSGLPGIAEWDPADAAGDMTEVSEGVYEITLSVTAGSAMQFKFAGNDMWDSISNFGGESTLYVPIQETLLLATGGSSSNLLYTPEADGEATFTLDLTAYLDGTGDPALYIDGPANSNSDNSDSGQDEPTTEGSTEGDSNVGDSSAEGDTPSQSQPLDEVGYMSIVGDGLPGIGLWDPADANGVMTEVEDNIFEIDLVCTSLQTMIFKFTGDGTWSSDYDLGHDSQVNPGYDISGFLNGESFALRDGGGNMCIPDAYGAYKFTLDLTEYTAGTGDAKLAITHTGGLAENGCGADLTWSLSDEGVLTVSGTGSMFDYSYSGAPWSERKRYIKAIVVEEGVTSVGDRAFSNCFYATQVSLPSTLTDIGAYAFQSCDALKSIELPDGLKTIQQYAFAYCNIRSIVFPAGLETIGAYAFSYNFSYMTFLGDAPAIADTSFVGNTAVAIYPENNTTWVDKTYGYGGDLAWYASNEVVGGPCGENVNWVYADGVLTISGTGAMYDYTEDNGAPWYRLADVVTAIVVAEGVTSVGNYAFDSGYYSSKPTVSLPEGLESIGACAFRNLGLTEITLPEGLKSIGGLAFEDNYDLTHITIPASVESIGQGAFASAWELTGFTVAEGNAHFCTDAYGVLYNKDMTTLVSGYHSLVTYTVPAGVTTIGASAFEDCWNLKVLNLPDGLKRIESSAFASCSFYSEGLALPDSLEYIGPYAFYVCELGEIVLPASLTEIGDSAFAGARVKHITVPDTVTYIGNRAFWDADYLGCMTFLGDTPEFQENALEGKMLIMFYPGDNATWTAEVMQNYGGTVTWVPLNENGEFLLSGTCGENLTWTLDQDGLMTVSGTGAMYDFGNENNDTFWYTQRMLIRKLVIEEGVTTVGTYAFENCDNLTEVVLPEGLLEIHTGAFDWCRNLCEISFPSTVEKIYNAFEAVPLGELYIPASVIYLEIEHELAHYNGIWVDENNLYYSSDEYGVLFDKEKTTLLAYTTAKSGGSYTVPSTVTTIAGRAFEAVNLDDLILNEGLLTIEGAFFNAKIKNGLVIPSTVINFDPDFSTNGGDFQISSITFLGDVPNYDFAPFDFTTATVYYPAWNATWTEDARLDMNGWNVTWVAMEPEVVASGTCGENLQWELDQAGTLTITGTGAMENALDEWLNYRDDIRAVVLPEGLTSICDQAFYFCENLTTIHIPASVTEIGVMVFDGCEQLTEINVAEDNAAYSSIAGVLYNKEQTILITAPDAIVSCDIPEGVVTIRGGAFDYCYDLQSVTLPSTLTTIGIAAFYYCQSLKIITIPEGITVISDSLFEWCTGLTTVELPDGVTIIDEGAFYSCSKLTNLYIGSGLTDIRKEAFDGCDLLTTIHFTGDAPALVESSKTFPTWITTAYYPDTNATWTEEVRQEYGPTWRWVPNGHVCDGHNTDGYCGVCGTYVGHSYVGEQTSQATCTTQEIWTYTCDGCGDSYDVNNGYGSHAYEEDVCLHCGAALHECIHDATEFCTICGAYEGHSYELVSSVESTCTTSGYKSYICADCGGGYERELDMQSHRYENGVCQVCGITKPVGVTVYFKNTEGWAAPHVYTWTYIDGSPKQYNGGWPGEAMEKVSGTEDIYCMTLDPDAVNIIFNGGGSPQTADLLVPTDEKVLFSWDTQSWSEYDAPCTHASHDTSGICTACGEVVEHSFENCVCTVCGCEEAMAQPTINLKYPTLLLKDEIVLNVYFEASDLEDVVEMGIITASRPVEDWSGASADAMHDGYQWSEAEGYYYVTTGGIAAKDIGSPIYFSVYARMRNGSYVYTKIVSYSPSTYAYNVLQQSDAEVSMKAMLVSMLNYGTAAQNYFSEAVDNPMNSGLTADLQALVDGYDISQITPVQRPDAAKQGAFASTGTGFGDKIPSITLGGTFAINYYFTATEPVAGDVTLYYWTAEDYAQADALSAENATGSMAMTGDGTYAATIDGIAAKDIDSPVYVAAVYSDGTATHCTGVLPYSIGTYCKTHLGTDTEELALTTAAYGYYAAAYFAS